MNQSALNAKKKAVEEITEGFKNSATVGIVSYQGLTVAELQELRKTLAEKGATLGVYKNTMVARALKDLGIEGLNEYLEGPNAFMFSTNVSDAAAAILKFSRYHEALKLKAAYVEGQAVDEKGFIAVAKLPTKEQLLSMFCMVLNEPMAGLARTLQAVAESKGATPVAA